MVDLARQLINFFRNESCGKCTPCRIGTERAYQILTGITEGRGEMKDLDEILLLSDNLAQLSNCGLGQTAGTPLKIFSPTSARKLRRTSASRSAQLAFARCTSGPKSRRSGINLIMMVFVLDYKVAYDEEVIVSW